MAFARAIKADLRSALSLIASVYHGVTATGRHESQRHDSGQQDPAVRQHGHPRSWRCATVRINDHDPYLRRCVIDLSPLRREGWARWPRTCVAENSRTSRPIIATFNASRPRIAKTANPADLASGAGNMVKCWCWDRRQGREGMCCGASPPDAPAISSAGPAPAAVIFLCGGVRAGQQNRYG